MAAETDRDTEACKKGISGVANDGVVVATLVQADTVAKKAIVARIQV